jgi:transposase
MVRHRLTDDEWDAIRDLFPEPAKTGRPPRDPRVIVDAILWVLRTGSPWRDLPERYGPYTSVYNRFNRWAKAGVWIRVFETLAQRSPQSLQLIDSSIVRAHQHAAGGKKGARITPSVVLVED